MEARALTLSPMDRALFIKSLPPFRNLPQVGLSSLSNSVRERHFEKGEIIHRPGSPLSSLHIVVDGEVRTQGIEHPSGVVRTGEGLGIHTAFAALPEGLFAEAATRVITLEISLDDLHDVFEDHFDVLQNEIRREAKQMLALRKKLPDGVHLAGPSGELEQFADNLDLLDRLIIITRGEVFRRTNLDALIELARSLEQVRYPAGHVLWETGDPPGHMVLLVRGIVRCTLPDGTSFTAGPGYPVGNLESQAGEPRWYRGVAETEVVGLLARTDIFIDVLEDHFVMALDFLGTMARGILLALEGEKVPSADV